MEKYCPKCHKVYQDINAKFCKNCATELKIREKRKPIPSHLRHQILVRDGYRCRECGKSSNETSLEIDHIVPLSKGGSTTEENLWTLCRECNQAKKDTIWQDDDIEIVKNELNNLNNQLREAVEGLKVADDEDDIIDYKFKIKKLNKDIPNVENKLDNLIYQKKIVESNRLKQQQKNKRKERLFKKLYVELEDNVLLRLFNYFSLNESSNEDNLRLLVDKFSENEISDAISSINEELKKEALKKLLNEELNSHDISLFSKKYSISNDKKVVIDYLKDNFSLNQINQIKTDLYEQERKQKEMEKEKERELQRQRLLKEKEELELRKKQELEKRRLQQQKKLKEDRKNEIRTLINEKFDDDDLNFFSDVLNDYIKSEEQLLNILMEFNDDEIYSIFNKVEDMVRLKLIEEIKTFNLAQCFSFAKLLSLDSYSKEFFISKLEEYPLKKVKLVINEMKEKQLEEKKFEEKKSIQMLRDEFVRLKVQRHRFIVLLKKMPSYKAALNAGISYQTIIGWYNLGKNGDPMFKQFYTIVDSLIEL